MSSGNLIGEGQGGAEEIKKVTVGRSGSSFIFKQSSGLDRVVILPFPAGVSVFDRCCFFGRVVGSADSAFQGLVVWMNVLKRRFQGSFILSDSTRIE